MRAFSLKLVIMAGKNEAGVSGREGTPKEYVHLGVWTDSRTAMLVAGLF